MKPRRIFQWFTFFLFAVTVWMAYANVLSDDAPVRALARATLNEAAGCGADCKVEGVRGDRGMFQERIEFDVARHGHWVVTCRRAYIAVGDHACVASGGTPASR